MDDGRTMAATIGVTAALETGDHDPPSCTIRDPVHMTRANSAMHDE